MNSLLTKTLFILLLSSAAIPSNIQAAQKYYYQTRGDKSHDQACGAMLIGTVATIIRMAIRGTEIRISGMLGTVVTANLVALLEANETSSVILLGKTLVGALAGGAIGNTIERKIAEKLFHKNYSKQKKVS